MLSSYEEFSNYIRAYADKLTSRECKVLASKLLGRAEQKELKELKEAHETMERRKRLSTHNCNITMINCNREVSK